MAGRRRGLIYGGWCVLFMYILSEKNKKNGDAADSLYGGSLLSAEEEGLR